MQWCNGGSSMCMCTVCVPAVMAEQQPRFCDFPLHNYLQDNCAWQDSEVQASQAVQAWAALPR